MVAIHGQRGWRNATVQPKWSDGLFERQFRCWWTGKIWELLHDLFSGFRIHVSPEFFLIGRVGRARHSNVGINTLRLVLDSWYKLPACDSDKSIRIQVRAIGEIDTAFLCDAVDIFPP